LDAGVKSDDWSRIAILFLIIEPQELMLVKAELTMITLPNKPFISIKLLNSYLKF
jgi:hypothetical protein